MSAELAARAGHYAAAVAEHLLEAGLPVTGIHKCAEGTGESSGPGGTERV
ncbi:hypothetical protein [Streptomyces sp. NPDC060031]